LTPITYSEVQEDVQNTRAEPVPLHLRNPTTRLMKELGYGKGYKYPHDFPGYFVTEQYLPQALRHRRYYKPSDQGFEKEVGRRLKGWREETKGDE